MADITQTLRLESVFYGIFTAFLRKLDAPIRWVFEGLDVLKVYNLDRQSDEH